MDMFFLLLGLGFFVYMMHTVERSTQREYRDKLNEAREFGFEHSWLRRHNRHR